MKEDEPIHKTIEQFVQEMQPGILYRILDNKEVILNAHESIILTSDELQVQHSAGEYFQTHREETEA